MEFGLIGAHLGHSFSPIIHGKIAPYSYILNELSPQDLSLFMKNREFRGINVTIPYKQTVMPLLDEIDAMAKEIGAVNTVVNRNGTLIGYNTDFDGMKALIQKIGVPLTDKKVLVLGSGGTSHTANAVAKDLGAREILTVSRQKTEHCITYEEAYQDHTDAEYIINTTPLGMFPHQDGDDNKSACPIDITKFPRLSGVMDAIFNPLRTNLISTAKEKGIPAEGGLYMLVAQAVFAAEHFLDAVLDKSIIERIYNELKSEKENIVLVGMPGCGKSTVGKALAKKLGRSFIDSDEAIIQKAKMSIPEFFEKFGEDAFRNLESEVIQELSAQTGIVLATGGGAVLRDENVFRLKRNGRLYFLDRALQNIKPTPDRPLSMNRAALQKRYEERYPRYCRVADCHIGINENIQDTLNKIKEDFFA